MELLKRARCVTLNEVKGLVSNVMSAPERFFAALRMTGWWFFNSPMMTHKPIQRPGRFFLVLVLAASWPAVCVAAETAAIRTRMRQIEMNLACATTDRETIYLYRPEGSPLESVFLTPCLLNASGTLTLVATGHHLMPRRPDSSGQADTFYVVNSLRVTVGGRQYKTSQKADIGFNDFTCDEYFRAAIVSAPKDRPIRVRMHGNFGLKDFVMTEQDRRAWRELAYYLRNFSYRPLGLPPVKPNEDADSARTSVRDPSNPPMLPPDFVPYPKLRAVRAIDALNPERTRTAGIEARSIVEALIDSAGTVLRAKILASSGNALLDRTSARAALDWAFTLHDPAGLWKHRHTVWVSIPFRFSLE
jgi:TonB family protein